MQGLQYGENNVQHNYFLVGEDKQQDISLRIPRQLPRDVANFVDRQKELSELHSLIEEVEKGSGAMPLVLITGGPGIGKTALATRWAYAALGSFPDGQIYINLQGYGPYDPLSPARALAAILDALGYPDAQKTADVSTRSARLRTILANRRVLLILDNAYSVDQVRPLIPGGHSSLAVVTSRESLPGMVARDGARRIELELLPTEDAATLLQELIGTRAMQDRQHLLSLVHQCARLPLALRIVAEVTAIQPFKSLTRVSDELQDHRRRMEILSDRSDSETAMSSIFSWSYNRLQPSDAHVFRMLGLHPGASFDIFATEALTGLSRGSSQFALDNLRRASLIEEFADGRYRMHDLVKAYAATLADEYYSIDDRQESITRLSNYYLSVAAIAMNVLFPADRERRPSISPRQATIPDVTERTAARRWLASERANIVALAVQDSYPQRADDYLLTVWRFLTTSGYYDDALLIADAAIQSAHLREDSRAEALSLQLSGLILRLAGRFDEARDHLMQAIHIQQVNSIDETGATSHFYLGLVLSSRGDYTQALAEHQEALRLYKLYNDQVGIANAEGNIGYVLWRLGRYEESFGPHERAIIGHRSLGHDLGEASTLDSLGRLYRSTGRFQEAVARHVEAIGLQREIEHHYGEAEALENLGLTYAAEGRFAEAISIYDEALEICARLRFENLELKVRNSRAEAVLNGRDVVDAVRGFESVLQRARSIGIHEEEARSLMGLAKIRELSGRVQEAMDLASEAEALYRTLGVPEADESAQYIGNLERRLGDE